MALYDRGAAARKHSHPTGEKSKQEVDLNNYNQPQSRQRYQDPGMLGINLPADVPMFMRCFRLEEGLVDAEDGHHLTGLRGWTVQLDAFTFGVTFYIKVDRKGTLGLYVEDESGREKLVEWTT